jgi:hypothetical protein
MDSDESMPIRFAWRVDAARLDRRSFRACRRASRISSTCCLIDCARRGVRLASFRWLNPRQAHRFELFEDAERKGEFGGGEALVVAPVGLAIGIDKKA